MVCFATISMIIIRKTVGKTFFLKSNSTNKLQMCSSGLLSFIKWDAWCRECFSKNTILFAVIYTYSFMYAFLVLRCPILFANEHSITTSKCTIYVATNISRMGAQYFDPKKHSLFS